MAKCSQGDIEDYEDVSGVLPSAYLVHGSASKVNHSGADAQVVFCHCYTVVFHPFVVHLTVFYISGVILWPAIIFYLLSHPSRSLMPSQLVTRLSIMMAQVVRARKIHKQYVNPYREQTQA